MRILPSIDWIERKWARSRWCPAMPNAIIIWRWRAYQKYNDIAFVTRLKNPTIKGNPFYCRLENLKEGTGASWESAYNTARKKGK